MSVYWSLTYSASTPSTFNVCGLGDVWNWEYQGRSSHSLLNTSCFTNWSHVAVLAGGPVSNKSNLTITGEFSEDFSYHLAAFSLPINYILMHVVKLPLAFEKNHARVCKLTRFLAIPRSFGFKNAKYVRWWRVNNVQTNPCSAVSQCSCIWRIRWCWPVLFDIYKS